MNSQLENFKLQVRRLEKLLSELLDRLLSENYLRDVNIGCREFNL
jgi:hypothetical protein